MSADGSDLSGVWYGRWTSNHPNVEPGSFIAVLAESAGAIDGTVSEPDREGPVPLRAALSGSRVGSQVQWIKQYDGSGRLAHAVYYGGRVNGEGTEISGGWRLGDYAGGFTMQRELFSADELEDEREIALTPGA